MLNINWIWTGLNKPIPKTNDQSNWNSCHIVTCVVVLVQLLIGSQVEEEV